MLKIEPWAFSPGAQQWSSRWTVLLVPRKRSNMSGKDRSDQYTDVEALDQRPHVFIVGLSKICTNHDVTAAMPQGFTSTNLLPPPPPHHVIWMSSPQYKQSSQLLTPSEFKASRSVDPAVKLLKRSSYHACIRIHCNTHIARTCGDKFICKSCSSRLTDLSTISQWQRQDVKNCFYNVARITRDDQVVLTSICTNAIYNSSLFISVSPLRTIAWGVSKVPVTQFFIIGHFSYILLLLLASWQNERE